MRSLSAGIPGFDAVANMLPWLRRSNYPVLTLSAKAAAPPLPPSLYVLTATQAPMSPYAPKAAGGAPQAWWMPVTASWCGSDLAFEMPADGSRLETQLPDCPDPARAALRGDPRKLGAFVVRYAQPGQWAGLASALPSQPKAYRRAALYHAFLLSRMSHEGTGVPAALVSAIGGPLDDESADAVFQGFGGWNGTADLYSFLLEQAFPVSAATGQIDGLDGKQALALAMARLLGPALARLGWPTPKAQEQDAREASAAAAAAGFEGGTQQQKQQRQQAAQVVEGAGVPWPTHEDAGIQSRARQSLRPKVAFGAVRYNLGSAVQMAKARFAGRAAAPLGADERRTVFYAAAQYGTLGDQTEMEKMLELNTTSASARADLVFALTAGVGASGAGVSRCPNAVILAASMGASSAASGAALATLMQYSAGCRYAAWGGFKQWAKAAWAADGAAATAGIVAAAFKPKTSALGGDARYVQEVKELFAAAPGAATADGQRYANVAITQAKIDTDLFNMNN
jgi:hypothetical protein